MEKQTPTEILDTITDSFTPEEKKVFEDINNRSVDQTLVLRTPQEKEVWVKIVKGFQQYAALQQSMQPVMHEEKQVMIPLEETKPVVPSQIVETRKNPKARMKRLGNWFARFKLKRGNQHKE